MTEKNPRKKRPAHLGVYNAYHLGGRGPHNKDLKGRWEKGWGRGHAELGNQLHTRCQAQGGLEGNVPFTFIKEAAGRGGGPTERRKGKSEKQTDEGLLRKGWEFPAAKTTLTHEKLKKGNRGEECQKE